MKKFVLKNSKGEYLTFGRDGMASTPKFKMAYQYTEATAQLMGKAYNQKFGDDMALVPADTESLSYFTKCLHHAQDQEEAKMIISRVKGGKYPKYDDATLVNMQGMLFVYAHERREGAVA